MKSVLPTTVVVPTTTNKWMTRVEQRVENYPNFGTELHNPDFAAYARACGGEGFSVERPAELAPAIVNALESGRPAIVDVETDPKRF